MHNNNSEHQSSIGPDNDNFQRDLSKLKVMQKLFLVFRASLATRTFLRVAHQRYKEMVACLRSALCFERPEMWVASLGAPGDIATLLVEKQISKHHAGVLPVNYLHLLPFRL